MASQGLPQATDLLGSPVFGENAGYVAILGSSSRRFWDEVEA